MSNINNQQAHITRGFSLQTLTKPAFLVFILGLALSQVVYIQDDTRWREHKVTYQVYKNDVGELVHSTGSKEIKISKVIPYSHSPLHQDQLNQLDQQVPAEPHWVSETITNENQQTSIQYSYISVKRYFSYWSLLPVIVAIALCLLTKEPLTALLGGIIVGACMLGRFDITGEVIIPSLATPHAASALFLTLWLLGGLLGIWSKTGASQALAIFMTRRFVKGPRSAKLVAWSLGVLFFQGGSVSTVLVGSTVKPVADAAKVSHEELSYIVDSTASPIASIIPFNAWPLYIQSLIFVPGVVFLSTEAERITFFFKSIIFNFYSIFAVIGTLLLSIGFTKFSGKGIRAAIKRSRETGQLDAPGAQPMSANDLQKITVPQGYTPSAIEFFIPLITLIAVAIGTFIVMDVPKIHWAFASALSIAFLFALAKGMKLTDAIDGIGGGLKSVVLASVILMLAITLGMMSREIGAGPYLVDLLGAHIPYWALPVTIQLLTMTTAFSTGTSWGTYPIVFPLAMPLAWAIAQANGISNPEMFMSICFAAVLSGSMYGDQCSPVSDTTILSSMTTGCDLMDHVQTQIIPANYAAGLAAILWTACAIWAA